MYDLTKLKTFAGALLYLLQAIVQVRGGELISAAVLHLYDENRIHIGIVLLVAILRPVLPFLLPVIRCSLKNRHIIIDGIRICDDDSILQQTRSTNFVCGRYDIMGG